MGDRSHRPGLKRSPTPTTTTTTSSSPTKGRSANSSIVTIAEQGEPDMAASFLQFCATCEKQILTPSNAILYCSEACRRKDSCKPLSLSAGAMTPLTTPPSSGPPSPRPILPARIPTGASYTSTTPSSRIPTEIHHAKSDLDPTEWKPNSKPRRGAPTSTNSEAFRYLARFHHATTNGDDPPAERVQGRPSLASNHRSTTSISSLNMANTPSLAQTPTTTSSSLSTSAEYAHLTYDFNTRPLPPRHDPSHSSSAGHTIGYELVMPHIAPPAAAAAAADLAGSATDQVPFHGGVWEKRTVRKVPADLACGVAPEGLGALFGGTDGK